MIKSSHRSTLVFMFGKIEFVEKDSIENGLCCFCATSSQL